MTRPQDRPTPPLSQPRQVMASLLTVGAVAALMLFATFGQFTVEESPFPRSVVQPEHSPGRS
ncbi:hypothetical protein [Modestobacter sp. SYSU DS0657]